MTYYEGLRKTIEEGYRGVDNTCNGICVKCGECCGSILPIDQEDANRIQEYVVLHNISTQKHMLVMQNKLQCPYYSGNKEKGCIIYEARPKICRFYKCDKKTINIKEAKAMENAVAVDMWQFALEVERRINGTNKKARKAINQSI